MEQENEYEEVDVNTQEETTSEDTVDTNESTETDEETVTLTKSELTKLKRKAIAYDAGKTQPVKTDKPKETTILNISPERLERIELMQEGYTKDEVDAIMDLGGSKALGNPIVKGAIETMRAKAKSENANQSISSKSPVFKKYTQQDLSKMSSKELEAILPKE